MIYVECSSSSNKSNVRADGAPGEGRKASDNTTPEETDEKSSVTALEVNITVRCYREVGGSR